MGTFQADISVGRDKSGPFKAIKALVDTGATYSMLPTDLLRELNIDPLEESEFTMADGSKKAVPIGEMLFRIGAAERTSPVIFGPPERFLLGAVTLQSLGLIADTSHHKLIPAPELTL